MSNKDLPLSVGSFGIIDVLPSFNSLKVDYHIIEKGLELVNVMHELCNWGKKYISYDVKIKPDSHISSEKLKGRGTVEPNK